VGGSDIRAGHAESRLLEAVEDAAGSAGCIEPRAPVAPVREMDVHQASEACDRASPRRRWTTSCTTTYSSSALADSPSATFSQMRRRERVRTSPSVSTCASQRPGTQVVHAELFTPVRPATARPQLAERPTLPAVDRREHRWPRPTRRGPRTSSRSSGTDRDARPARRLGATVSRSGWSKRHHTSPDTPCRTARARDGARLAPPPRRCGRGDARSRRGSRGRTGAPPGLRSAAGTERRTRPSGGMDAEVHPLSRAGR
jgi:hypothetical protein